MKNLQITVIMLTLFTSVSFADIVFDYTISTTYEYGVEIEGEESLLVTGGGADQIDAWDFSYIEIRDTAPLQMHSGGINVLHLNQTSSLNYYDGETGGLKIYDNATAILQGGQILGIESYQNITGGPHIEIKSDDYDFNLSTNLLAGTWLDGSAFSITLVDQTGYDDVIDNIFFTPEPTSLLLLGLGGLVLRRKKS